MRKYGLINEKITPQDQILGANSPVQNLPRLQENGDWKKYLPVGELQKFKNTDMMNCVSQSACNCLEILLKRKAKDDIRLMREYNFSDRYLARASDTTTQGNTLQNVGDTLKYMGTCDEMAWPYPILGGKYTWNEYYSAPSTEATKDALQNKIRFDFDHVWVKKNDFKEVLKKTPIQVTVSAWSIRSGIYYSPELEQNHAVVLIGYKENEYWEVLDTYEPFVKRLEWNFNFGNYGKIFLTNYKNNMIFQDEVLYKVAVGNSMYIGWMLDGRMVTNQNEEEKFNVWLEGLSRCKPITITLDKISDGEAKTITMQDYKKIVTVSQDEWNSVVHISLKKEVL